MEEEEAEARGADIAYVRRWDEWGETRYNPS